MKCDQRQYANQKHIAGSLVQSRHGYLIDFIESGIPILYSGFPLLHTHSSSFRPTWLAKTASVKNKLLHFLSPHLHSYLTATHLVSFNVPFTLCLCRDWSFSNMLCISLTLFMVSLHDQNISFIRPVILYVHIEFLAPATVLETKQELQYSCPRPQFFPTSGTCPTDYLYAIPSPTIPSLELLFIHKCTTLPSQKKEKIPFP